MKIQNLYRRYPVMTTITLKNGYYIEIDPLHYGRNTPEKPS